MSPQLDGEEIEAVVRVRACPGFDRVHLAMAIGRVLNSLQASGDIARGFSVGTSSAPADRQAEGRRAYAGDPSDDAEDTGSGEGRDTAAADCGERELFYAIDRCPECKAQQAHGSTAHFTGCSLKDKAFAFEQVAVVEA